MTRSPRHREPRPVPIRRYRYSKWRWRILVRALDAVGDRVMALWRRIRPIGPWATPRRILVVQIDHLGDAVLSSPIFPRLKAAFPGASIDVLASPSNRAIFEADPHVDAVRLADRNWFERRPGRWALGSAVWSLGRSLRSGRYDLGIDVRGDVLTVIVLALAGIPRRVGWAMGGGGFLLTDLARWEPGRHEVRSRLALLEPLGILADSETDSPRVLVHYTGRDQARIARRLRDTWPEQGDRSSARRASRRAIASSIAAVSAASYPDPRPTVACESRSTSPDADSDTDTEPDWLHAGRFGAPAPLLAVHLGAGTVAKRWPVRHWVDLIDRFLSDGWRVVIVGGPDDSDLAASLTPHPALRDWTGRLAVTETTALLERADLFLGADSGPAHLAASVGVPSVVLFSGTNRVGQWRPWSRRTLVLRHVVSCRPCHRKHCPLVDHPCMTGLTPDHVYRASRRWWSRLHRSESPHAPL